jgi:hypothetical protein
MNEEGLRIDKNSSRASEGRLALRTSVGVKIVSTGRSLVRNLPRGHACGRVLRLAIFGILVVIRKLDTVESLGGGGREDSKGGAVRPCG